MQNIYKNRMQDLQNLLKKKNFDAFLLLGADIHFNEYLSDCFNDRAFISGFSGSFGNLIITQKNAVFFTDARYFLQAEKELKNTNIELETKLNFLEWLELNLSANSILALNDKNLSLSLNKELKKRLKSFKIDLFYEDLMLHLRKKNLITQEIYEQKGEFIGEKRKVKFQKVCKKMSEIGADLHFISSLDHIAYLTNLRGKDIEYNPVFFSFLLISKDKAFLFVDRKKLPLNLAKKLEKDEIFIKDYFCLKQELTSILKQFKGAKVLIDELKTSVFIKNLFKKSCKNVKLIKQTNPSSLLKALKNKKQISHIKEAMIADGVALCEFFAFVQNAFGENKKLSELSLDKTLSKFRAKNAYYISDSFANIIAFNENSALPHYRATQKSFSALKGTGLLLVDSGAQYENGTTDITRVVPLGKVNTAQKKDYTLVLKALIALSKAVFPVNLNLSVLDALARAPLWSQKLDFEHGTGHGVGYFLNVHESPPRIAYKAPFSEQNKAQIGFVSSVEPALYKKGQYGIRLENLVVFESAQTSEFGEFLRLETLSLCPFEISCLDLKLLNEEEKAWLNAYHDKVFKALNKHLSAKALKWLKEKTQKI